MNTPALSLPPPLRAVYAGCVRRYGAPGTRLDDFAGRWVALRADQAGRDDAPVLIDVPPAAFGHDFNRFRSLALHLAGGRTLVLAQLHRRCLAPAPPAAPLAPRARRPCMGALPPQRAVQLVVESTDQPVAAFGLIELDATGVAQWAHAPRPLHGGAQRV